MVTDDIKGVKDPQKLSPALQVLVKEVSLLENLHFLGLFTMKNPGSRNTASHCSVYQTPFSMFILFDEMVLRVDEPFEFKEVAPRKSQSQNNTPSKQRAYQLKCKLAGKNQTFMVFRPEALDKSFHQAQKALKNDSRLPWFLNDFVEHLNAMEKVIEATNNEAKRLDPNVTMQLTMQMLVDALYSEYIKRPAQFRNLKSNDPFAQRVKIIFGPMAYMILRYLLEYGKTPNQFGCYGQAKILQQDIDSGLSSRNGVSLNSLQDIINAIDTNLARDFKQFTHLLMSLSLLDAADLGLNRHLFNDDDLFD